MKDLAARILNIATLVVAAAGLIVACVALVVALWLGRIQTDSALVGVENSLWREAGSHQLALAGSSSPRINRIYHLAAENLIYSHQQWVHRVLDWRIGDGDEEDAALKTLEERTRRLLRLELDALAEEWCSLDSTADRDAMIRLAALAEWSLANTDQTPLEDVLSRIARDAHQHCPNLDDAAARQPRN